MAQEAVVVQAASQHALAVQAALIRRAVTVCQSDEKHGCIKSRKTLMVSDEKGLHREFANNFKKKKSNC